MCAASAVGDVHRYFEAEAQIGKVGFRPGHCSLLDFEVELAIAALKSGFICLG
jgi:hypothetical protein